eukprot:scaffold83516_cov36-Phaeocystis_antarctica.AAC.1
MRSPPPGACAARRGARDRARGTRSHSRRTNWLGLRFEPCVAYPLLPEDSCEGHGGRGGGDEWLCPLLGSGSGSGLGLGLGLGWG